MAQTKISYSLLFIIIVYVLTNLIFKLLRVRKTENNVKKGHTLQMMIIIY